MTAADERRQNGGNPLGPNRGGERGIRAFRRRLYLAQTRRQNGERDQRRFVEARLTGRHRCAAAARACGGFLAEPQARGRRQETVVQPTEFPPAAQRTEEP